MTAGLDLFSIAHAKSRNPNIEIRNKLRDKNTSTENPKHRILNEARFEILSILFI